MNVSKVAAISPTGAPALGHFLTPVRPEADARYDGSEGAADIARHRAHWAEAPEADVPEAAVPEDMGDGAIVSFL